MSEEEDGALRFPPTTRGRARPLSGTSVLVHECVGHGDVVLHYLRSLKDTDPPSVITRARLRGALSTLAMLLEELDRRLK